MSSWNRVGAAAVGLLFALHFFHWSFLVDDAFISFRYAANFAGGDGLVYNAGEHVEGYSNFLWVMLLALSARLHGDVAVTARVLGFLIGAGALVLVYRAARRCLGCGHAAALGSCALLASMVPWAFWAGAGLETMLVSALLLALWAALAEPDLARGGGANARIFALLALLALTRPEGAFAFPFVLGYLLAARRTTARSVMVGAAAFVIPVGGHLAWRLAYYGDWLPNSSYAKVGGGLLAAVPRGIAYGGSFLVDERFVWVLPILALGAWSWRFAGRTRDARRAYLLLALVLGGYLVFVVAVGGDGLYRHRFFAHCAPLLAVSAAPGLDWLAARRWWSPVVVAALASAALVEPVVEPTFFGSASLAIIAQNEARWEAVGRAIDAQAPPALTLATNVAGKLPFFARRATIDLLGLCDRTIAHTPVESIGVGYAGHERAAPAYVLERAPDLLYLSVLDGAPLAMFTNAAEVGRYLERTPLRGYRVLYGQPDFLAAYRPALLDLGGGQVANVIVRKGSAADGMRGGALRWLRWASPGPV